MTANLDHKTLTATLAETAEPLGVAESPRNGPSLYGYDSGAWTSQNGNIVRSLQIRADEADVIRTIFRLHAEGCAALTIAEQLNSQRIPSPRGVAWTKASVLNVVGNRAKYAHGYGCPPILNADLAQRSAVVKTRRNRCAASAYAFNGLVTCGRCGDKMEVDRYNRARDSAAAPVFVKYRCRKGGHDTVSFKQKDYVGKVNEWLLDNLDMNADSAGKSFKNAFSESRGNDQAGEWRPGELRAAYESLGLRFVYQPDEKVLVVNGLGD